MTSCLLCASLRLNRSEICFTTKAEAQSHAAQHLLQTKFMEDDCSNLVQVIEQCFPNAVLPLTKRKKIGEGRQLLLDLCRTLLKGRISKVSSRVTCQKCESGIDARNFRDAIDHASVHLASDLFECRKCVRSFRSQSAVKKHLVKSHCLRGLTEYFTDKSADFLDEITASIKQCFSESNGASDKKTRMISLRNESDVRCHTKGSKQAVERQLFCYQLMRQHTGEDGKIQCRLCSRRIVAKKVTRFRGHRALERALGHLKKPLIRCKVCSKVHSARKSAQEHLMSAHSLPLLENYVCLADEFHSEIMNLIRKCYVDESESK